MAKTRQPPFPDLADPLVNPLWAIILDQYGWQLLDGELDPSHRSEFIRHYAHTITCPCTVWYVQRHLCWHGHPQAVSIGAGTGYMERLLALPPAFEVIAFDIAPPDSHTNPYHSVAKLYHPIQIGGPERAADFPYHALFLSWPPPGPMAHEALQAYRGQTVIFMGVPDPTINGDGAFYHALATSWEQISSHTHIRWRGTHDGVHVYRRR